MTDIRTDITHVLSDPSREHWAIVRRSGQMAEVVKLAHSARAFTESGLLLDMQALCGPGEHPVFIAQAEARVGWLVPVDCDPDDWAEVHQ